MIINNNCFIEEIKEWMTSFINRRDSIVYSKLSCKYPSHLYKNYQIYSHSHLGDMIRKAKIFRIYHERFNLRKKECHGNRLKSRHSARRIHTVFRFFYELSRSRERLWKTCEFEGGETPRRALRFPFFSAHNFSRRFEWIHNHVTSIHQECTVWKD